MIVYNFKLKSDAQKQKKLLETQTGKKYKVYPDNGEWCVSEKTKHVKVDWDKVEQDFDKGWE